MDYHYAFTQSRRYLNDYRSRFRHVTIRHAIDKYLQFIFAISFRHYSHDIVRMAEAAPRFIFSIDA